jgi:hypothetical protein
MIKTTLCALGLTLGLSGTASAQNVIRNGSFEGSRKYWIFTSSTSHWEDKSVAVSDQQPAFGENSLFLEKDSLTSTPFPLTPGKPARVSFSARSKENGKNLFAQVLVNTRNGKVAGSFKTALTTDWKRYTFTFTPGEPGGEHTWMLMLTGSGVWIDGVSVEPDAGPRAAYEPRRALEVAADWTKPDSYPTDGNLVVLNSEQTIRASVSNPGKVPQTVKVRWQMMDYTGKRPIGDPVEKSVTVEPGKVVKESVALKAAERGQMLARVSVLGANGEVLDSSDQPITVMPFPKNASTADWDERIGCSLRGDPTVALARVIGFRWCRWWWGNPYGMCWNGVQPDSADQWAWPDEKIDYLANNGFAVNYVLFGIPEWAKAKNPTVSKHLPADMQWRSDDPRWEDLSIQTGFDKYITAVVTRYKDKKIAWEAVNEPEIHDGGIESDVYFALVKRMSRLVKAADPQAFFMTSSTWGNAPQFQVEFFNKGGGAFVDAYGWHNYGTGPMGNRKMIRTMKTVLKSGGNEKAQIWFNEGGTFVNSSQDYAALIVGKNTPAEWANLTVRSMAEMFSAGHDKHILFHIGYGKSGRSTYDWLTNGGTELWDEFGQPTIGVPVWNVLIDSIGLSDNVERIKNTGFELHVFQDKRNGRGVVVAFATDKNTEKSLVLPVEKVIRRDLMGNDTELPSEGGKTIVEWPEDGRPFYLFTSDKKSGADLAAALTPLGN